MSVSALDHLLHLQLAISMSNQSPHMPKFGDWDESQSQFTVIFDNMRATKSMKRGNPNDPAFLAELLNSSSASQAVAHDAHSPRRPPSPHESPQKPVSMNHTNSAPHVPKFGEWNGDGETAEQQQFTLIFDNMHAVKSKEGFDPKDPESLADLQVVAPKFGDWDVNDPQEFTAISDDLKHERRHGHVPASEQPKRSNSLPTPPPKHKPFLVSLRLCFGSGYAVRD